MIFLEKFISQQDIYQVINEDTQRSVAVHDEAMMGVKVKFSNVTKVPDLHQHPHRQMTYVIKGRFTFWVDGKEIDVQQGDVLLIKPNLLHGCICKEAGSELLDVFNPCRTEFLD